MSEQIKNIYQRINAVMQEVSYIKKDASVQSYMAVSHDNVVSVVRASLVKNGIVITPTQIEKGNLSQVLKAGGEVSNQVRLEVMYRIIFVNIDQPEDRFHVDIESHANDTGDKAPGKALTYATKMAILKVFCLETGIDDESRTAEDDITFEVSAMQSAKTLEELQSIFVSAFKRYENKKDIKLELSKVKDVEKMRLQNG